VLSIATVNVNGIRAAARRDELGWIRESGASAICLQEVRAPDELLHKALADHGLGHLDVAHFESSAAGRAGVAVLSEYPITGVIKGIPRTEFVDDGRWIETLLDTAQGPIRVVSVYVHTGEAGTGRQAEKYRFLDAMTARMKTLRRRVSSHGEEVVISGDLNIAHTTNDLKNWRGNKGKAGFLPEEQEYLTGWFDHGWTDLGRQYAGDREGPYTWWSWRGQAFDNDTGWRLDYILSTPGLASALSEVKVHRAESYAQRWSDHAPVVAKFGGSHS
jgi:exodeoxyribonuclease-3